MSPITHLLVGWGVANAARLNRRERALVMTAGIIPDVDGLGVVAEVLTRNSEQPLQWWSLYHHVLGHNIGFALLVMAAAFALSSRSGSTTLLARGWLTACLAMASFHLHILGDLVGGRGPDGYQWPIPYLVPFSNDWQLTWSGQWALNAWPNFAVTGALLILTFYLAWRHGRSPLEAISVRANEAFVSALRGRFGQPQNVALAR